MTSPRTPKPLFFSALDEADVVSLLVLLCDGDDRVHTTQPVDVPTTIHGGAGDGDRVTKTF